jgi:hypothetical protein
VQTATIDQIAGLANLTTFLRTRPGMIESDWPVCAITDTATPHQSDRYSYCGDHGVCFEGVTH